MRLRLLIVLSLFAETLNARGQTDSQQALLKQILDRLDGLEKENRSLGEEVRALRQQLEQTRGAPAETTRSAAPGEGQSEASSEAAGAAPPIEERVEVEERRTAEQAQTKVEAAHKLPIQLNGMLLFNAFANSGAAYRSDSGNEYGLLTGPNRAGATLRQTILGLDFQGPTLPGDGHVNGSVAMDFWNNYGETNGLRLRLRRAEISLDWKNRSFSVGQDKPLISPYQPDSLAEVGIPPLAGAGNLWLWLPQARYEERLHFGTNSGLKAQVAAIQTDENYDESPGNVPKRFEPARPALEGRLAFWHRFDDQRRFEIAPAFHVSTTHVAGTSVGSHIASLDWLIVPSSHLQLTGTVFKGQNVAGLGALGNGFSISPSGAVAPVESSGGWAQVAVPLTKRFTWNVFVGLESNRSEYLTAASLTRNWTYASNVVYHLGPNVVVSLEALQARTRSSSGVPGTQNHYDLALGYLF